MEHMEHICTIFTIFLQVQKKVYFRKKKRIRDTASMEELPLISCHFSTFFFGLLVGLFAGFNQL